MSKKCQLTGRTPKRGYSYAIRGIAKKKKGIGLKITGKTKRKFKPNLHVKRFWFADENRFVRLKVCAAAMRTMDKLGMTAAIKVIRSSGQKV